MSISRGVTAGHCRCPEGGIFDRLSQFCLPVHVRFAPKPHLGVKVARPETPVVSISGDGGFLFGAPELATAIRHGIAVTAIVFDDGAYGNVKRSQELRYGNRLIAWDLANPDFVRLAESFGITAARVRAPDGLTDAIVEALESRQRPGLVLAVHVRSSRAMAIRAPAARPVVTMMIRRCRMIALNCSSDGPPTVDAVAAAYHGSARRMRQVQVVPDSILRRRRHYVALSQERASRRNLPHRTVLSGRGDSNEKST